MSRKGVDQFLSSGNLTIGQVLTMFQNQVKFAIVKKHNPAVADSLAENEVDNAIFVAALKVETGFTVEAAHAGAVIEEKFGTVCLFYDGSGATNKILKEHIGRFIKDHGPDQKITLLLNRVKGDESALDEQVVAGNAHLGASTHWTVLSLEKDSDGKLSISKREKLLKTHLVLPQVIPRHLQVMLRKVAPEA
jgi:hypothetical protein